MTRRRSSAVPSARPAQVAARAAELRRLEVRISRLLDGVLAGEHRTVRTGPGSERAAPRRYEPGDDARRIDWNLTARSAEVQVRATDADRELETWIIADRSASLDFGTTVREKREVALAVVAAFGFLAARSGNRIGLLLAGGPSIVRVAPRCGRTALMAALAVLHDQPRHAAGPGAGADLPEALTHLERVQARRGQLVVVSDFLDAGDWATPLRRLGLRHEVIAVQVVDPRELALPDVGLLAVVDPETGRTLEVPTGSARLRERYATAAAERHAGIARRVRAAGARHLVVSTEEDWLVAVARFVGRDQDRRLARVR
ncbi:MAG: DUF58 domain-containing protein [Acidimicrobiales bacterium]